MQIFDKILGLKILVVGDVMLDRYWWGGVNRISPEAPVPIVQLEKTSLVAGGAANVAANLSGLGAIPFLFGIKGDDDEGKLMTGVLSEAGIENHSIVPISGRKTTIKTRIVAHGQHVVRIDQESTEPLSDTVADNVLERLSDAVQDSDAVIISDYAKGLLSNRVLTGLIGFANSENKLIVVDPKGRDFNKYKGATVITPNKREAADAAGLEPNSVNMVPNAGTQLIETLGLKALLITEGENGMTLFQSTGEPAHFETLAQEVYDVTGAGDTVIATFTASVAAGSDFIDAVRLANAAAGIVVGHIGTTKVTRDDLVNFLASHDHFR
ncbi:hypothetical protein BH10ACI2_BH10ACI2_15250 [soil metagenome]